MAFDSRSYNAIIDLIDSVLTDVDCRKAYVGHEIFVLMIIGPARSSYLIIQQPSNISQVLVIQEVARVLLHPFS